MQEWASVVPAAAVDPTVPMKMLYCPTSETTALTWLLHSSVTQNQSSLVVGPAGCGKTTAIRGLVQALTAASSNNQADEAKNGWKIELPGSQFRIDHCHVTLGSQTDVGTMQRHVDRWFSQRTSGGVRLPAADTSLVAFIDDVSMPIPETSGAQPALEVLRQIQVQFPLHPDVQSVHETPLKRLYICAGSRRLV